MKFIIFQKSDGDVVLCEDGGTSVVTQLTDEEKGV
jgi:hypothetical protein